MMANEKKDDTTIKTDHQKFIERETVLLQEREDELKKLQSKKNIGEAEAKRIKILQRIVHDIQFNIDLVKMYMSSRRPYGM